MLAGRDIVSAGTVLGSAHGGEQRNIAASPPAATWRSITPARCVARGRPGATFSTAASTWRAPALLEVNAGRNIVMEDRAEYRQPGADSDAGRQPARRERRDDRRAPERKARTIRRLPWRATSAQPTAPRPASPLAGQPGKVVKTYEAELQSMAFRQGQRPGLRRRYGGRRRRPSSTHCRPRRASACSRARCTSPN
jgi:hypothetical protein